MRRQRDRFGVCGDAPGTAYCCRAIVGLSSRAQGNPDDNLAERTRVGSIPAGAGEPHPSLNCGQRRLTWQFSIPERQ
jgi:hypothetical protein